VPSLCDVIFFDAKSDVSTSIHERIVNSYAAKDEQVMDELKDVIQAAGEQLWINVFERADYQPQDLIKLDSIDFVIPVSMRTWLHDSVLVFERDKFYLLRGGRKFSSLSSLVVT
jgi:hypothetical protein